MTTAPILRIAVQPYWVNPYRWHAIVETQNYYQTAEVNTWKGTIDSEAPRDVIYVPRDTPSVEAAKQTSLGKAYLDWGKWAVVRDIGQYPVPGFDPPQLTPGRTWTTVEFIDLRFAYAVRETGSASGPPLLSGYVYIVDGHEDAGEFMNGQEQK